jgi:hypothetical protein
MNALVKTPSQNNQVAIANITEADLVEFLNISGFSSINNNTKTTFMKLAQALQLNPFKKEIYITGYKTRDNKEVYSVVTGYQTFIKLANRTGLLNGWKATEIRENGTLVGAKVTIYRKDWDFPFEWDVVLSEFDKGQSTWNSMKGFMIRKVAIGQGFRLCFEGVEGFEASGLYEEAELVGIEDAAYVKQNEVKSKPEPKANPAKELLDWLTNNGLERAEAGKFVKEHLKLTSKQEAEIIALLADPERLVSEVQTWKNPPIDAEVEPTDEDIADTLF